MPKKQRTYQDNFIAGVRELQAKNDLDSTQAAAEFLGIAYMTLYKIMDKSQNPTVEHGILLCKKGGYSANWLFLNKGEIYYNDEVEAEKINQNLKSLRDAISAAGVGLIK